MRAAVGDEVDLGLCGRLHAILQRIGVYDADIDGIASPFQLVVDNVLHQVGVLNLPKAQNRVAQPGVHCVEFGGSCKIAFALDVIANGPADEKGVFEEGQIFSDGDMVGRLSRRGQRVRELGRIGQRADVAHCEVGEGLQERAAFDVVAFGDVTQVNRVDDVLKIVPLFSFGRTQDAFRESSVAEIEVSRFRKLNSVGEGRVEFRKGKRRHVDNLSATSEISGDLGGEEFCVRSSDVNVGAPVIQEAVEDVVESQIAALPVLWRVAGQVDVGREDLPGELDFVNENEAFAANGFHALVNQVAKSQCIAKGMKIRMLKIDLNDVARIDAGGKQVIFEEAKQKIAFPASPNAGDDFDQVMAFGLNQPIQEDRAGYCHRGVDYFKECCIRMFVKANVVYHISPVRTSRLAVFERAGARL